MNNFDLDKNNDAKVEDALYDERHEPIEIRRSLPKSHRSSMVSSVIFDEGVHYWTPPPTRDEEPLHVDFRCACFKLNNVSTVDFSVKIKFVIVFEWIDERLILDDGIYSTNDLPRNLWGPDVILENAENDCEAVYDSFSLLNSKTGLLKRTVAFHGAVYNPMDLKDFPFDSDELELKFISICNWRTLDGSRYGNDVCNRTYTLHPMLRRKDVQFFVLGWGGKIPEFQILGWSQKVTTPDDVSQPICFKFDIHLVRKANFYYLKIMLPLWLLVLSSVAAFGIETDDLGARLEVLFTLLLSTIAFLYIIQESIPKINRLTVIDKVVLASLITLVISVVFSSVIARYKEDEAVYLNIILAVIYPSIYIVANILIIGPAHWRHNKLKAKLVSKQELENKKGSQFGSFHSLSNTRKSTKLKMAKSYSMSGNVMDLRGSHSSGMMTESGMMGFAMPEKIKTKQAENDNGTNFEDSEDYFSNSSLNMKKVAFGEHDEKSSKETIESNDTTTKKKSVKIV